MGRGRGGYTKKQPSYKDSGGRKVNDNGSKFVAERYIDLGFEVVFRRQHQERPSIPSFDLTIKTSNDKDFVKNIEVKSVFTNNPVAISRRIEKAGKQISIGDTVAIYLPKAKHNKAGIDLAKEGINRAKAKKCVIGPIEVWYSDKERELF